VAERNAVSVITGVVAGSALAAGVLALDGMVGSAATVRAANARTLVGATFAAVVTVGAFAFWMRPVAAQLAASTVPPRLVSGRLHDTFQRRTVTVTVGVLAYEAIVLLALPTGDSSPAPMLATVLGGVIGVGAVAGLLVAMQHAERSTRPGVLVAEEARRVMERIREAADDESGSAVDVDDGIARPSGQLLASTTGWMEDIREDDLLARLPAGARVHVEVDVGSFVIAGWTPVASILVRPGVDVDPEAFAGCFRISDERAEVRDLAGALAQFVDIAVHAASGGSGSPSTVYETMWHLGAIIHELCAHQLAVADRHEDGAGVVVFRRIDSAELVARSVDRLRQVTASDPSMALELVVVLRDARRAARRRGRRDIVEVLDEQGQRVVDQCRHASPLPVDLERVVSAWNGRSQGRRPGRPAGARTVDGSAPTSVGGGSARR
jgi:uncharacterized membrane protein